MARWYFSHRFVDEFSDSVIEDMTRVLPPPRVAANRPGTAAKKSRKTDQALALVRRRVSEFQSEQPLNLFQRARLSQRLEHALLSRDYPPDFAQDVALAVALRGRA